MTGRQHLFCHWWAHSSSAAEGPCWGIINKNIQRSNYGILTINAKSLCRLLECVWSGKATFADLNSSMKILAGVKAAPVGSGSGWEPAAPQESILPINTSAIIPLKHTLATGDSLSLWQMDISSQLAEPSLPSTTPNYTTQLHLAFHGPLPATIAWLIYHWSGLRYCFIGLLRDTILSTLPACEIPAVNLC